MQSVPSCQEEPLKPQVVFTVIFTHKLNKLDMCQLITLKVHSCLFFQSHYTGLGLDSFRGPAISVGVPVGAT